MRLHRQLSIQTRSRPQNPNQNSVVEAMKLGKFPLLIICPAGNWTINWTNNFLSSDSRARAWQAQPNLQ